MTKPQRIARLTAGCLTLLLVGATTAVAAVPKTRRVSIRTNGKEKVGTSYLWTRSVSADGRFAAFESNGRLVKRDQDDDFDIYLRDRKLTRTSLISIRSNGNHPAGGESQAGISADGRFVTFQSVAKLAPNDTNPLSDVYIRDRKLGKTKLISVRSNGAAATNGDSSDPTISANGRYVAFTSSSTDLVNGDGNGSDDVFLRDRRSRTTIRVSVPTGGGDADGQSHRPDVSDLGGVAFSSEADDLVGSDTNGMEDAFVHTPAGKTKRVSVASNGDEADNGGSRPSISRTGNKIAFQSESTNLSSLAGGQSDVYVHTMADGKTRLASRASNGTHPPGSAEIFHGALSFSGRFIAFTSDQALVTADANSTWDMYWHDMKTGKTRLASYSQDGSSAAGSDEGTISGDGRWVGFDSTATNLVPDDGNGTSDGFLRGPMI